MSLRFQGDSNSPSLRLSFGFTSMSLRLLVGSPWISHRENILPNLGVRKTEQSKGESPTTVCGRTSPGKQTTRTHERNKINFQLESGHPPTSDMPTGPRDGACSTVWRSWLRDKATSSKTSKLTSVKKNCTIVHNHNLSPCGLHKLFSVRIPICI